MVQGHFNDLELDSRQEPCSSSPLVVGKFWRRRTRQNNNFAKSDDPCYHLQPGHACALVTGQEVAEHFSSS